MSLQRQITSNLLPTDIGIQAIPPVQGVFQTGSFHQKAVNEFFGVDEEDTTQIHHAEQQLRCFKTHEELLAALAGQVIRTAMVAVDNTYSGRVATAIEALRVRGNRYKIIGRIAIAVDQHLLLPAGLQEKDVEQVISQLPALKQAGQEIDKNGWKTVAFHDTVASAVRVQETGGNLPGSDGVIRKTAAIASVLAGKSAGLTVGPRLSQEGNATTFWLISDEPEKHAGILSQPTHSAFTFSVPDSKGGLLDIVSRLSDAGFDLTDIDCHLAAPDAKRSFFTEVRLSERATSQNLMSILEELGEAYDVQILGTYEDRTKADVHTAMTRTQSTDLASIHALWNGRNGEEIAKNSPVVYVEATNTVGSLKGMLESFYENDINIVDMSRPYAPTGNGARGFYFVLAPSTPTASVLNELSRAGYQTQLCVHDGEKLQIAP